ncbi:MAG: hypothetical protein QW201_01020 [Thermoproteota archaeon]
MGVRVKIRVVVGNKTAEATTLVNSGFETDKPQLPVPHNFLLKNKIDLEDLGRPTITEYDTAGGPITMYMHQEACIVNIIEEDKASKNVKADLVISPIEREVLISDALIEELELIILSPRKGLWKFAEDSSQKVRQSYKPQYW